MARTLPVEQHPSRPGAWPRPARPGGRLEPSLRLSSQTCGPADRAGVGLGVKAPVERVVVLALAVGAHGKGRMVVSGPVVGDVADDGEARPAVGAVGEGIAVAAVGGVEQLAQAVGAGGDVGRDELVAARLGHAVADLETRRSRWGGASATSTATMRARGGASAVRSWTKASRAGGGPSTSISTPPEWFSTQPVRPWSWARR